MLITNLTNSGTELKKEIIIIIIGRGGEEGVIDKEHKGRTKAADLVARTRMFAMYLYLYIKSTVQKNRTANVKLPTHRSSSRCWQKRRSGTCSMDA